MRLRICRVMAYVYRHIRLDTNQPFYIGVGLEEDEALHSVGTDFNRLFKRANFLGKRNSKWKEIVSNTNYIVEILISGLTPNEALKKEDEFIKFYGRCGKDKDGVLCNIAKGGKRIVPAKYSEDQAKEISKRLKELHFKGLTGKIVETRIKNFGKKIIQKTKDGKVVKIWRYLGEIVPSLKSKQPDIKISRPNIVACLNGRRPFAGGFIWQYFENPILFEKKEKKIIKFRGPRKSSKKIVQKTLTGETVQVWDYIKQIENYTNIKSANIHKCIIGKRVQAGGFKWETYEE